MSMSINRKYKFYSHNNGIWKDRKAMLECFSENIDFVNEFREHCPKRIQKTLCDDFDFMYDVILTTNTKKFFACSSLLPSKRLKSNEEFAIKIGSLWQHYLKRYEKNVRTRTHVILECAKNGQFAIHWAREYEKTLLEDKIFESEYRTLKAINDKKTKEK